MGEVETPAIGQASYLKESPLETSMSRPSIQLAFNGNLVMTVVVPGAFPVAPVELPSRLPGPYGVGSDDLFIDGCTWRKAFTPASRGTLSAYAELLVTSE